MAPSRGQLVELLETQYNSLSDLGASLSARDWHQPSALPGWDVLDVYAHLIGQESELAGAEVPTPSIDVAALPHVGNSLGVRNEIWVEALSTLEPDEMLARFREVTAKQLATIRGLTGDELACMVDGPDEPLPRWRLLQLRQFDCWMHEQDVREALVRPGNESGRCAEAAVNEAQQALPRVLADVVPPEPGSPVVFLLTGPVYRTVVVGWEGFDFGVTSQPSGEPAASITLSSSLFMRLVGGRSDTLTARLGGFEFGGDLDLAARVVANLVVTG